ncbi:MAG: hypothetical protein M1819_005228 [Sarea resinae]|nr:MAG: hypothetical protein M1819_005228 [Sarea resinae]
MSETEPPPPYSQTDHLAVSRRAAEASAGPSSRRRWSRGSSSSSGADRRSTQVPSQQVEVDTSASWFLDSPRPQYLNSPTIPPCSATLFASPPLERGPKITLSPFEVWSITQTYLYGTPPPYLREQWNALPPLTPPSKSTTPSLPGDATSAPCAAAAAISNKRSMARNLLPKQSEAEANHLLSRLVSRGLRCQRRIDSVAPMTTHPRSHADVPSSSCHCRVNYIIPPFTPHPSAAAWRVFPPSSTSSSTSTSSFPSSPTSAFASLPSTSIFGTLVQPLLAPALFSSTTLFQGSKGDKVKILALVSGTMPTSAAETDLETETETETERLLIESATVEMAFMPDSAALIVVYPNVSPGNNAGPPVEKVVCGCCGGGGGGGESRVPCGWGRECACCSSWMCV